MKSSQVQFQCELVNVIQGGGSQPFRQTGQLMALYVNLREDYTEYGHQVSIAITGDLP